MVAMRARHPPITAIICSFAALSMSGCSSQPAQEDAPAVSTAVAAQSTSGGQTPALVLQPADNSGSLRLASDYKQKCAGQQTPSRECQILRSLLVAEVSTALELIQRSGDQRGVAQALVALDFPNEPDLFIAACRILAKFPTTPGIAAKVLPQLLENRSLEVQRISANLLTAVPDPIVVDIAQLWLRNHSRLSSITNYDPYPDFPGHYAGIGFPQYPGAVWFSPADSDRSIGWSTKDDLATVTNWFTQTLKTDAMDYAAWRQRQSQQMMAGMQSIDQSKIVRMQQLMPGVVKGDQAAVAELERLQAEMTKASEAASTAVQNGVANGPMPPDSVVSQARWIVAKQSSNHMAAVVMIYPVKGVQRTVIQLMWDLGDYAPAWRTAENR